jgi:hypothetical protein
MWKTTKMDKEESKDSWVSRFDEHLNSAVTK